MTYKPVVKTITFTGSAQQVHVPVAGGGDAVQKLEQNKRFVVWASIEALEGNAARCYIGDSAVSATNYSTSLAANEQAQIGGPEYSSFNSPIKGRIDLAKVYIIGTSTQKAMLTVFIPDED